MIPSASPNDRDDVIVNDEKFFPVIDRFGYLGSILTNNCSDREDVLSRIKKAGNMFGSLKKCLFGNKMVYVKVKGKVYESLILFILLHGSESWCLTEELYRWLRNFHNRCVRAMCDVNMIDVFEKRITTESLLIRLGISCIDVYVVRRQLRWAGHVARMEMDRLPRKMLSSWVNEKRPRGSPEMTYGRSLMKALKRANVDTNDWYEMAKDRNVWKNVIDSVS